MLHPELLRRQRLNAVPAQIDPPLDAWPADPPVWTGHQPWLWHPGILAKYLAADAVMSSAGPPADRPARRPFHNVVVDHDAQDALRFAVPVQDGDALRLHRVTLAPARVDVPAGCQPAADSDAVIATLRTLPGGTAVDVDPVVAAFDAPAAREAESLGRQLWAVLEALLCPWLTALPQTVFSSQMHREPWFGDAVKTMLHDAAHMAATYNAAVRAAPQAGVAPLRVEPDRVEAPLWLLAWDAPRRRVFIDLADSTALLTTEAGDVIDPATAWLAPKALLMTALLRRRTEHCGLFVHGTGGGAYDRVMESWWHAWRGEPLAPRAIATADLTLPLSAPVHTRAQLDRAVWHRHHLPHNLDRAPGIADAHPDMAAEKRDLLAHMDDDRHKPRRRAAFDRVHALNAALADAHPDLITDAERNLQRTRTGLRNHAIARRRDWCFALYPDTALQALRQTLHPTPATSPLPSP